MWTPEERQEVEDLKREITELKEFIELYFNPDGTLKIPPVVIETEDTTTTPAGSIRVITNKGPKNILIA